MKQTILIGFLSVSLFSHAQSLEKCEQKFISGNLSVLAAQYNIDAAKARRFQAGIWELPQLSAEINALNPDAGKIFDVGKTGQKSLQIDQLFYLGNKKRLEKDYANANVQLAELEFRDLLRNLQFQLRSTYYKVYFNKTQSEQIRLQLNQLDSLIASFKIQVEKKNIATKDLLRLQSLYLNLNNTYKELLSEQISNQSVLRLLCASDSDILVSAPNTELSFFYNSRKTLVLDSLYSLAQNHRPDYLATLKSLEADNWYLQWQKSLTTPDLRLGGTYDQRGGAFHNQVGLTLSMPLNIWNPNKGKIMEAEFLLRQKQYLVEFEKQQLNNDIKTSFQNYVLATENLKMLDGIDLTNYLSVFNGYVSNFQKRNISLLEFIDFMESFNTTISQFNQIRLQYINACLQLNTSINLPILK